MGQSTALSTGARTLEECVVVVSELRAVARDVLELRLTAPDGRSLPAWRPGAHLDVILPSGRVRQYSLCGDDTDTTAYTIAVLREPHGRGGSKEVHETGLLDRELRIRGPRNNFPLIDAGAYLFIAGGIGITPILPMIRDVHRGGKPWTLHYGGRTRSSMAFVGDLLDIDRDRVRIHPEGEAGLLDLPRILADVKPWTEVYCCGPDGLLTAVEACLADRHPGKRLRYERFTAPRSDDSAAAGRSVDAQFEVELRRSGLVLTVPPGKSVYDVVSEAVPTVISSCEEGFCGTCETRVLDGLPDHRDTILSDEERARGDRMYICVSRAQSPRLVLDL